MTALACNAAVPPQIAIAQAIRNPLPRAGRQAAGNRWTIPDGRIAADARPGFGRAAGRMHDSAASGATSCGGVSKKQQLLVVSERTMLLSVAARRTGPGAWMCWHGIFLARVGRSADGATMTDPTDGGHAYIGGTMAGGLASLCISDDDRCSSPVYLQRAPALRAITRTRAGRLAGAGRHDRSSAVTPIGLTGGPREPTMGRRGERRTVNRAAGQRAHDGHVDRAPVRVRRTEVVMACPGRRSPGQRSATGAPPDAWPGVDARSEHRRGNWITGRGCRSAARAAGRALHSSSRSSLSRLKHQGAAT
jgi:hypothetical protein